MKLQRKWSIALLSLALAGAGTAMFASAQQTPSPTPQTPPAPAPDTPNKPAPKGEPKEEKHPRLQKAIEELRAVKVHLEKAPHDFGGHKAEAVKAVTEAIHQLELAVKFDKN
jgi:hypothetical protein